MRQSNCKGQIYESSGAPQPQNNADGKAKPAHQLSVPPAVRAGLATEKNYFRVVQGDNRHV